MSGSGYFSVEFLQLGIENVYKGERDFPSDKEIEDTYAMYDEAATLTIRDNGADGDGLCLEVHFCPELKDCKNMLFGFTIPNEQVAVVAEALASIVRMRKAVES